ncbi:MAG: hypothetical protein ACR2NH_12835 [Solirubrobacteraceae bacterium]
MSAPPDLDILDLFFGDELDDADVHGEVTTGRNFDTDRTKGRPRGYAKWAPRAETQALLEDVRDVLDEYADHLPLTIRQVFYRLVAAGYPKDERAYARLCNVLGRARRARMLPFEAIRDDGVVTIENAAYDGVEDFEDETGRRARNYRRDRQEGQPARLELWCEAAGMLGQLARVAEPYSVPVFSAGGFGSLTANHAIAQRALDRLVPTVLLHVGDFDPSGVSIFEAMAEDAAAFVKADRTIETLHIEPVRVALTAAQVRAYGLPTTPAKKSDGRSRDWKGGTCQLEALAPDQLAKIVRKAILDRIDLTPYAAVLAEERDDRAELLALPPGDES